MAEKVFCCLGKWRLGWQWQRPWNGVSRPQCVRVCVICWGKKKCFVAWANVTWAGSDRGHQMVCQDPSVYVCVCVFVSVCVFCWRQKKCFVAWASDAWAGSDRGHKMVCQHPSVCVWSVDGRRSVLLLGQVTLGLAVTEAINWWDWTNILCAFVCNM